MPSTRYDSKSISAIQVSARCVLLEMDGLRHDGNCEVQGAANQANVVGGDRALTTAATLVSCFNLKGRCVSIEVVNESLDILVSSGLVPRHNYPIRNYSLRTEGKTEVEALCVSRV